MCLARRREATEESVDEHHSSRVLDRDVMNVDITGRVSDLRNIDAVKAIRRLSGFEDVFKAPELIERRHPNGLSIGPKSQTAIESPLEDRQPTVRLQAQEKDFAGLIGRERETDFGLRQPRRELPRRRDFKGWLSQVRGLRRRDQGRQSLESRP